MVNMGWASVHIHQPDALFAKGTRNLADGHGTAKRRLWAINSSRGNRWPKAFLKHSKASRSQNPRLHRFGQPALTIWIIWYRNVCVSPLAKSCDPFFCPKRKAEWAAASTNGGAQSHLSSSHLHSQDHHKWKVFCGFSLYERLLKKMEKWNIIEINSRGWVKAHYFHTWGINIHRQAILDLTHSQLGLTFDLFGDPFHFTWDVHDCASHSWSKTGTPTFGSGSNVQISQLGGYQGNRQPSN